MMRSYFSDDQIIEQESRIYFSEICNKLKWKYRTYEQDNDVDGEIELFEKKTIGSKEYNETKAEFVKIQLKASSHIDFDKETISYPCSAKLLQFADVCDQPVVLILYNGNKKVAYWLWLQEYIYNYLDINNKSWRDNSSKVTIGIPTDNMVMRQNFEDKIKQIAENGINDIFQFRKINTIKYYYTEISHEDNSLALYRRILVRILVEKSFSKSKDAMRILIQKLNKKYEVSDYYRNEQVKLSHPGSVDILWMHFYNDPRQVKNGLPYCQTEWSKPGVEINTLHANETINGIKIHWGNESDSLEEFYVNERMQKGEYIELLDDTFKRMKGISEKQKKYIEDFNNGRINSEMLILNSQSLSKEIQEIHSDFTSKVFAPYECEDVDHCMIELLCLFDDIRLFVCDTTSDERNKLCGIRHRFDEYSEKLKEYAYERNKIR
jgi:hypothetical protein